MEPLKTEIDEASILDYLNGEDISEDKLNRIEAWLKEDGNIEEARRIYQVWELSALTSVKSINTTQALTMLKNRLGLSKPKLTIARRVNMRIWYTAACFTLIIFITWFLAIDTSKEVTLSSISKVSEHSLLDGSNVTLNKNTQLRYEVEAFNNKSQSRTIDLSGEAYFEVFPEKTRPFIVRTRDAEIEVLGTKFLVVAYNEEPTQVMVTEGKVQVTILRSGKTYTVEADHALNVGVAMKPDQKPLDMNNLYWKTGMLHFENDSLKTVFKTLSNEFGIKIHIRDERLMACKLTATFKKQSLDTILEVIKQTHAITVRDSSNIKIINGKGCY